MYITRNITTYVYSYGVYDTHLQTLGEIFTEVYEKPLGERSLAKRLKELNEGYGECVLGLGFKKAVGSYRMDVKRFIELAERLDYSVEEGK